MRTSITLPFLFVALSLIGSNLNHLHKKASQENKAENWNDLADYLYEIGKTDDSLFEECLCVNCQKGKKKRQAV